MKKPSDGTRGWSGNRKALQVCVWLSLVLFGVGINTPSFEVNPSAGGGALAWMLRVLPPLGNEPTQYSLVGSVVTLVKNENYLLALVVGGFSILFPICKLFILVLDAHFPTLTRNRWLWVVSMFGHLSMLDVMVIAIFVVASKSFPGGLRILPMWGAYVFGASVLLSILAGHGLYHQRPQAAARRIRVHKAPNGRGPHRVRLMH